MFSGVGYVQVLSSDVVLGNSANAHYQGKALGNLKAGFSAANFEKLVGKWFFGTDHPKGTSDWGPTYSYRQASGQLFVNGAAYTDVNQGGLGDCYFLASLAEVALKNPSAITSMFIVNGDGTYTVRFYNGSEGRVCDGRFAIAHRFGRLPGVRRHGPQGQQLQQRTLGRTRRKGVRANERIRLDPSGQLGRRPKQVHRHLRRLHVHGAVANHRPSTPWRLPRPPPAAVSTRWSPRSLPAKKFASAQERYPASSSVVGNHAYAVVGYNASANRHAVQSLGHQQRPGSGHSYAHLDAGESQLRLLRSHCLEFGLDRRRSGSATAHRLLLRAGSINLILQFVFPGTDVSRHMAVRNRLPAAAAITSAASHLRIFLPIKRNSDDDSTLRFTLFVALLSLVASRAAQAWNYGGHMVSGVFCYDVLKQDSPETLAKVVEILKQHPHFEKRWAKQLDKVDPDMRDRLMFMLGGPLARRYSRHGIRSSAMALHRLCLTFPPASPTPSKSPRLPIQTFWLATAPTSKR